MSKIVITTVGASLLEKDKLKGTKDWIEKRSKNDVDTLLKEDGLIGQRNYNKNVNKYLLQVTKLKDYSAEIASLKLMGLNKDNDRVILLYSDTPAGAFCARANAIFINKEICQCELGNGSDKDVRKIENLKIETASNFVENGLGNLCAVITNFFMKKKDDEEFYINFTGGFKGEIPLITIMAQNWFNGVPLIYLFEPEDIKKDKVPELITMIVKKGEDKMKIYTGGKEKDISLSPPEEV